MSIYRTLQFKAEPLPRALALGFFDGLHRGHQALLQKLDDHAAASGLRPTVFTFLDPPGQQFTDRQHDTLRGHSFPGVIQPREERLAMLAAGGHRDVVAVPLVKEIYDLLPEAFLEAFFVQLLDVRAVFVGRDFSFGRGAAGRVPELAAYCRSRQIHLTVLPDFLWEGQIVSSTRIRSAILAGAMTEVTAMLGRPYRQSGVIREGRQLGRKLGFPTLNFQPAAGQVLPPRGVYASRVSWQGRSCPAVSNLGVTPTVTSSGELRAETFLYGQDVPRYGDTIDLDYLAFLRPEEKFADLGTLRAQVLSDIAGVRSWHQKQDQKQEL